MAKNRGERTHTDTETDKLGADKAHQIREMKWEKMKDCEEKKTLKREKDQLPAFGGKGTLENRTLSVH